MKLFFWLWLAFYIFAPLAGLIILGLVSSATAAAAIAESVIE